jgi:HAD superfamily hydrolase (TIGR01509 family)
MPSKTSGATRGDADRGTMDDQSLEVVFFDIRDTLGVVDRKGHLVKYQPSTDQLLESIKQVVGLRIGLITNLPADVSAADGKKMVDEAGIAAFLDPKGFVTNHDAGADKPRAAIYAHAARQMGVPAERCLFVGENLVEVIGAQTAGMRATLKPFPPGREFLLKPIKPQTPTEKSSGRLAELIMEEDHLVGKRIVGCGIRIKERLEAGLPDDRTQRAMGMLVWLTNSFVDLYHHRKEEEVLIPFAMMRGFAAAECAFVAIEHAQGRNYFKGMEIALQRFRTGDEKAAADFRYCLSGFIDLYKEHGRKEDDILLKRIGDRLTDSDDALILELMGRIGPTDITLYLASVAEMELELGI